MKNKTTIIVALSTLVIGLTGGYVVSQKLGSFGAEIVASKEAQSVIDHREEERMKMSKMMLNGGKMLEQAGVKLNDNVMIQTGKDMMIVMDAHAH